MQKKSETLRSALEFFDEAAELDPGFRLANMSAGYSYLHLAYVTDGSKAQSRPLLIMSAFYLERFAADPHAGWSVHRDLAVIYDALGEHRKAADQRLSMFVGWARTGNGKQLFTRAEWVVGGNAFAFPYVINSPAYDIPKALYVVDADGKNPRAVWKEDFTRFLISPDGKRALIWSLGERWSDSPEVRRMAAVNLVTGRKKWFREGMAALTPGAVVRDGKGEHRQSIKWSPDARSVTLLVYSVQNGGNWRRETLRLP
jgi:hypothetical protein